MIPRSRLPGRSCSACVGLSCLLAPVAVLGGGAYLYLTSGRYQSTDDAYTQAATVSISANVAGRVSEVDVHDNEIVKRGAALFRLDDAPFRIAVSDAAARLAATRLQIASLKSTYRQRQVELRAARDTQRYAQQQYDRQTRLLASGIASQAQFDQASHALDAARQQVANVQQQIGVALANLGGDPNIAPERHPLVEQAQAALDRARLDLSYTVISAPTDGVVAKVEQLQVGDTSRRPRRCLRWCRLTMSGSRPTSRKFSSHECSRDRRRPSRSIAIPGRTILGDGHERQPEHGFAVFAAAAGKRHRQLGQGGAASAGAPAAESTSIPRSCYRRD